MSKVILNSDHFEVLQELANIAMGKAGSALAEILDTFIRLSVPNVMLVDIEEVAGVIPTMIGNLKEVTVTRQAFYDQMDGEAFVIYGQDGCDELAELMGYEKKQNQANNQELLLDITNILVGACLNNIAKQLDTELSYTPPSIYEEKTILEKFFRSHDFPWKCTLLFKVAFSLEEGSFTSHILIFLSEQSVKKMEKSLEKWLEML